MGNRVLLALRHPIKTFYAISLRFLRFLPDASYLKVIFRLNMGYSLHLDNPKTFNEKIQWLKLYDRKPEYTVIADKLKVRDYVADKIGEEYLVPLLGVWDQFEDIDFDQLPDQFVLKCTHDSGSVVICTDRKTFDIDFAKKKIEKALKSNFYRLFREWAYKDIQPRIIAEKFLCSNITDYKFHCFQGTPRFAQVIFDRFIDKKNNTYTLPEWNFSPVNIDIHFKTDPSKQIPKPKCLPEMMSISTILASISPYLRVDLYYIEDRVYFSELTLYPSAGFLQSYPDMSMEWGSWIKLPQSPTQ